MRHVVWADPARRALRQIVIHYAQIAPELADRIVETIVAEPDKLLEFPDIGSPTPSRTVRRWRIRSLPYRLTYRVTPARLTILQVHHSAQDIDQS